MLKNAIIIQKPLDNQGIVHIGSTIEVKKEKDDIIHNTLNSNIYQSKAQ